MPASRDLGRNRLESDRVESMKSEVRLKQIQIAPFTTPTGSSYSVLGLGEDGKVYRFDPKCDAWLPWSMRIANCKDEHKAKR